MTPGDVFADRSGININTALCDSGSRRLVWFHQGCYNCLDGHPGRAYRNWGKDFVAAEEVGMPYELGPIHLEMGGRHAASDDQARTEHLRQTREIFERMRASYRLARVGAALESPET